MNEKEFDRLISGIQKPSWYAGTEYNAVKKNKSEVAIRFAYCFPDMYDVGMSHLGMKLLYHMLNERSDLWCERVYAPNTDMENRLRETKTPLFTLESKDFLTEFDFVAFTLNYELSYSNILTMLELAGIPFLAKDRDESYPILLAGGPCMTNPEPVADFFDIIDIGEGEENLNELMDLYKVCSSKNEFLLKARDIEGIYVPNYGEKQEKVTRAIIKDFEHIYSLQKVLVPSAEVVHDRVMLEIMRGCIRGCRFCQAGIIYRPYRQRSPKKLLEDAVSLCKATGYDEISLTSLSTSDYEKLPELTDGLLDFCTPRHIDLSLPSLRVDNFTQDIYDKVSSVRKSGLTFAPEAGTQRLRDVINKNVTDEEIENTCRIAFSNGASSVKLYFMIGLPTETDEDILGIAKTAMDILYFFSKYTCDKSRGIRITISLSTFVPKAHTPFQWEPQLSLDEIHRRQMLLKSAIKTKKITLNYHDGTTSVMEGVFARGDRKLSSLLIHAHEKGCKFDAWTEYFSFEKWTAAMKETGITFEEYAMRRRSTDEALAWDFVETGITKDFYLHELEKAYDAKTTPNCAEKCAGCGVNRLCKGDVCP